MLKKYRPKGEIEFRSVYFNSRTKTMINHKFSLENAFEEILYRIDNWINKESGWIVKLIESQYIDIPTYRLLSGSSYVKLPAELRRSNKGIISIKNNDQKCFLWCHININEFCYENKLIFPIYISNQKFENLMDLLLIINVDKSHFVYIKDFDRFMFQKIKTKNCKKCLQCFSSKNVLTKHKEVCLSINGAQSVRLEKGTIEFKNYFKQIPVPFKIYADFECNLKTVESYEGSYSKKKIKITFFVVLLTNLFVFVINLPSQ